MLTTIEAALVSRADGSVGIARAPSSACRACGMCGGAAEPPAPQTTQGTLRLRLPGSSLTAMAIGIYGVPFAGLLGGVLLAAACGAGDAVTALAAIAGCGAAACSARGLTRTAERRTLAELERYSDAGTTHAAWDSFARLLE